MSKNFLITGGAGFIGANLIRALALAAGTGTLRVLDNLSAGRAEDLAGLPVDLVVGDIRDREVVASAMKGVNIVIHLAAHTGVVQSVENPAHDLSINVLGTLNLLEAARENWVERFIFASTGGAIVGNVDPPVHEEMPPRPISPYGASKLAAEGYCSAFWGSYGLKTVALRFSNIYGPFSYHKGSVVAKFLRLLKRREELTVFGDGEQTRDFLYVEDLCQAIVRAVAADLPFGKPIQLGTGKETSINQLLGAIKQVVGPEMLPKVNYAPTRPGEVQRNFVSISRAEKYLNFAPPTGLEEGLKRTWNWFLKEN